MFLLLGFFSPVEITCLAPPMTTEEGDSKQKPKYFFDSILELMAVKVRGFSICRIWWTLCDRPSICYELLAIFQDKL